MATLKLPQPLPAWRKFSTLYGSRAYWLLGRHHEQRQARTARYRDRSAHLGASFTAIALCGPHPDTYCDSIPTGWKAPLAWIKE